MSVSRISPADSPSEKNITRCLQRVVRDGLRKGEEVTVNIARSRLETELGLNPGFLKTLEWKDKSKAIIQEIAQAYNDAEEVEESAPAAKAGTKRKSAETQGSSKKRQKKAGLGKEEDVDWKEEEQISKPKSRLPAKRAKAQSKAELQSKSKAATSDEEEDGVEDDAQEDEKEAKAKKRPVIKRAVTKAKAKTEKKQPAKLQENLAIPEFDDDSADLSDEAPGKNSSGAASLSDPCNDAATSDGQNANPARRATVKSDKESALSEPPQDDRVAEKDANTNAVAAGDADGNDSEYSVVHDDGPAKKSRGKKAPASRKPLKKPAKAKLASKALSPQDEEMKRLQGWLVKCGIRKIWHKELANCSTPNEKIKHLRGMLADAGMTGRPSQEKASHIKEARELAEEIEAAKAFNEQWGEKGGDRRGSEDGSECEDEAEEKSGPAARRLPKGLVDFEDSGDDSD